MDQAGTPGAAGRPAAGAEGNLEDALRSLERQAGERAVAVRRLKRVNSLLTLLSVCVIVGYAFRIYQVVIENLTPEKASLAVKERQDSLRDVVDEIWKHADTRAIIDAYREALAKHQDDFQEKLPELAGKEIKAFNDEVQAHFQKSIEEGLWKVWRNHEPQVVGVFPELKGDDQGFANVRGLLEQRIERSKREIFQPIVEKYAARLDKTKSLLDEIMAPALAEAQRSHWLDRRKEEPKKGEASGGVDLDVNPDLAVHYLSLWLDFASYELKHPEESRGAYQSLSRRVLGEQGAEHAASLGEIIERIFRPELKPEEPPPPENPPPSPAPRGKSLPQPPQ